MKTLTEEFEKIVDHHGMCPVVYGKKCICRISYLIKAVEEYNTKVVGEDVNCLTVFDAPEYQPGDEDRCEYMNQARDEIRTKQKELL